MALIICVPKHYGVNKQRIFYNYVQNEINLKQPFLPWIPPAHCEVIQSNLGFLQQIHSVLIGDG